MSKQTIVLNLIIFHCDMRRKRGAQGKLAQWLVSVFSLDERAGRFAHDGHEPVKMILILYRGYVASFKGVSGSLFLKVYYRIYIQNNGPYLNKRKCQNEQLRCCIRMLIYCCMGQLKLENLILRCLVYLCYKLLVYIREKSILSNKLLLVYIYIYLYLSLFYL